MIPARGAYACIPFSAGLGVAPHSTDWQPLLELQLGLTALWEILRIQDARDPGTFYQAYEILPDP